MNRNRKKFDQLVEGAKRIVITTHIGPDADAVCSTLATYSYLKKIRQGEKVRILITGQPYTEWEHFKFYEKIDWVDNLADHLGDTDLIIFLDGSTSDRFFRLPKLANLSKFKSIRIDHHPGKPDKFTLDFSDLSAVATCQIIANMLFDEDKLLDKATIETLLIGIFADSGGLRYVNHEYSKVFESVKRLVDLGKIEIQLLQQKIEVIGCAELELIQSLFAKMTNIELKNLAGLTYSYLPKSVLKKYSMGIVRAAKRQFMYLILRRIKDHPWGFTVVPGEQLNEFSLDFRALPGAPNVRLIANRYFEGGGHNLAAGGRYVLKKGEEKLDSKDICQKVLKIIKSAKIKLTPVA